MRVFVDIERSKRYLCVGIEWCVCRSIIVCVCVVFICCLCVVCGVCKWLDCCFSVGHIISLVVNWPSGLRRQFKALV